MSRVSGPVAGRWPCRNVSRSRNADGSQEASSILRTSSRPEGRSAPDLAASVAALIGTATPLQLLTERLARARGTNPDLMRRDDPVYHAAAETAAG